MLARLFALAVAVILMTAPAPLEAITRLHFKGSAKQRAFLAARERYVTLMGGYGSGKSYVLPRKVVALCIENTGLPMGLVGGDFPRINRDILPPLFDFLSDSGIRSKHYKVDRKIVLEPGKWNSTIHLMSTEKGARLKGPNLAAIAGDEPGTWPEFLPSGETVWGVLVSRVRHPLARFFQVALVGTPEGAENWFSRKFDTGPEDPAARAVWAATHRLIRVSTYENRELPASYTKELESNLDAVQRREKLWGIPTAASGGRAYYAFDRSKHVRPTAYDRRCGPVRVGMDFNVDPMAAVLWQKDGDRCARIFAEIIIPGSNTWEMAETLAKVAAQLGVPLDSLIVYPDPAGRARSTIGMSNFDILRRKGLRNLRIPSASPSQRDRLNVVNGMFDHMRIVVDPGCVATIRDFAQVKTRPLPSGLVEIDKRNPNLTHPSDGFGYSAHWEFPIRRPSLGVLL